jgi:serine/threonine-protein kinase
MAEVFKARVAGSAGFQRYVVLKRMHAAASDDPELVSMFTDEARLLGFLRHPNVVQALDFYKKDGQLSLVLEYLEGPTLSQVFRRGRVVPPEIVAYIGREICRALEYVHGVLAEDGTPLGVVHRDVTPSNVIITPAGAVKLLDFGVAKFACASHSTRAGVVPGKPSYLAPEQMTDVDIDGRVDLFALGSVLHELLTGARLFRGSNDLATLGQILEMTIPTPSSRRAGVPPELDRIVMRALERDRTRRYQSAAELGRDLDELVLGWRVRAEDVAAFLRGDFASTATMDSSPTELARARDEATSRAPALARVDEEHPPTRRDLRLPLVMCLQAMPGRRRSVLVAVVSLALGLGTLSVRRMLLTVRAPVVETRHPPVSGCAPPAPARLVSSALPAQASAL